MDGTPARHGWRHGLVALALTGALTLALSDPTPSHAGSATATQAVRVRVIASLGWTAANDCRTAAAAHRCAQGRPPWQIASTRDRHGLTLTLHQ
jgi:hypothetical protein